MPFVLQFVRWENETRTQVDDTTDELWHLQLHTKLLHHVQQQVFCHCHNHSQELQAPVMICSSSRRDKHSIKDASFTFSSSHTWSAPSSGCDGLPFTGMAQATGKASFCVVTVLDVTQPNTQEPSKFPPMVASVALAALALFAKALLLWSCL